MKRILLSLVLLFSLTIASGCITSQPITEAVTQVVPWYQDIQNWTPYQKANFFMDAWEAQLADYKMMNSMPNKSPELVTVTKAKYQLLEQSRIPVRQYVAKVNGGGIPDPQQEQQLVSWIRQLQTLALQSVK